MNAEAQLNCSQAKLNRALRCDFRVTVPLQAVYRFRLTCTVHGGGVVEVQSITVISLQYPEPPRVRKPKNK